MTPTRLAREVYRLAEPGHRRWRGRQGDPWRIGECQVELVVQSLGRLDGDLARSRLAVILEGGLAKIGLAQIVFHVGS
jgi:hypothetical protein